MGNETAETQAEILADGASGNWLLWEEALIGGDDDSLRRLADTEPPGDFLLEIASYINGLYRGADLLPDVMPDAEVSARVARLTPLVDEVRARLSAPDQRAIDLAFLQLVRRSSCLSLVLGAGVTQGAGGPGWADLVDRLLQRALERGHETREMEVVRDNPRDNPTNNPEEPLVTLEPDGALRFGKPGRRSAKSQVVRTEWFSPDAEREARQIRAKINAKDADTEILKRGVQLCSELWGQHLFTHVTGIIYGACPKPGPAHRAIAELADAQRVPGRGPNLRPGWASVITYNFDDLMGEALDARSLPRAAFAMNNGEIAGDPNEIAREDQTWFVPILHLHGYTPRRPFLITHTQYAFSTAQYEAVYGSPRIGILKCAFEDFLANPVQLALYIGCSFTDEAMNDLLRQSAARLPGRRHFALLSWPDKNTDPMMASADERMRHEAHFHEMGVQPLWIKGHDEIPDLIRALA